MSDNADAPRAPSPVRDWSRRFLVTALVAAIIVAAIGWTSGLRNAMHGALISVAVVALLPFVIIAVGLAIALLAMIIGTLAAALTGGDAGAVADGVEGGASLSLLGAESIPMYYRFLLGRRHPLFWGTLAGLALGGLALLGLIAVLVIPGETRTAVALANAQDRIEATFAETGRFPEPDAHGHLPISAVGNSADDEDVLLDGFSRPIRYEVFEQAGRLSLRLGSREVIASRYGWYHLTSAGFDGKPSRDDLRLVGDRRRLDRDSRLSTLMEAAQAAWSMAQTVRELVHKEGSEKSASLKDKLRAVRFLRRGNASAGQEPGFDGPSEQSAP